MEGEHSAKENMIGTIKLKEFGAKPFEEFKFYDVQAEHWGVKARFRRGLDDETHRPKVYKLNLFPGSGGGNWEVSERDHGLIEHVHCLGPRIEAGVLAPGATLVIEGMWVENGMRMEMNVTITNVPITTGVEAKAA